MKLLSNIMIAFLAMSLIVACKNTPEGEKATVGEAKEAAAAPAAAKEFAVNSGTIYWTGTKVGGSHSGTFSVQKGIITTKDGNIASGEFGIDMTSMTNTDLPDEKKGDLVGHLSSGDFFDVQSHPTGNFEIVSVTPVSGNDEATHNITGNLTLKGITKSITMPAFVVIAGDALTATTPKFTINRTEWDIKYGSGIIGTAKDKVIHDDVSLNLEIKAQAK